MASESKTEETKQSGTYNASCHCGYIRFAVTLSPPLEEQRVLDCNCSICRRMGYLLVCKCLRNARRCPGSLEKRGEI